MHGACEPLAVARLVGQPHAAHLEPNRSHRGRHFEFELEQPLLDCDLAHHGVELLATRATHPVAHRCALGQAIGIGMQHENIERAVPGDAVFGKRPVERRRAGACNGEPEMFDVLVSRERSDTLRRLPVKRTRFHCHHPWPFSALCG